NSSGSAAGISCTVTGLDQTSVYYFMLKARKSYLEYVDDVPAYVSYSSLPAIKVIVTPSDGDVSQPVTPPKPPFKLKKTPEGRYVVTDTTAVVQIKKKWYEKYNPDTNKWEYLKTEKDDPSDPDPTYPITPEELPDHKDEYRMLEYGNDVKIDVYYVEYEEGMDYQNLYDESKYKPVKIAGFPVIPNDETEDPTLNYPDKKERRNVDILITGLKPNTTYVIWVKAVRMKEDSYIAESEPSDPVIVTTNPSDSHPVEIPTVPALFVNNVGDTYVDLIWDFIEGYNYYIDYSESENMNPAAEGILVDLKGMNYYRVEGLKKDTIYYFRIRAEYVSPSGESRKSDWSDPCSARTLADVPPHTPQGFGIKTSKDAITKNSITYEWVQEEGLEYILEIAENPDFENSKEYNAGMVSEYKADNLKSNHRYYARLYAYDPSKNLRSKPTGTVSVMTKRSTDDYDADEDVEDIITGDFVEKHPVIIDNTMFVRIIGVNADRFIEHVQNDDVLDYKIGLEVLPANVKRIKILIAARVFNALTKLKENLIIAIPQRHFIIRPEMLDVQKVGKMLNGNVNFNFEINIELESSEYDSQIKNIKPLTKATGFRIFALDGENPVTVSAFKKPLKVTYLYTDRYWYTDGQTFGFIYNEESSEWEKAVASAYYDRDNGQGYMSFEVLVPGDILVAELDDNFYDDIGKHWAARSIKNVASAHALKSIPGRKFDPDSFITVDEAVKFMLDMMDYDYGNDYMILAVRSGIASSGDVGNANRLCTREKLITMTVRLYELKSGEKAVASGGNITSYKDINEVSPGALQKVKFAIENGIIISRFSDTLGPKDPVTRAEAMVLLEKLLVFTGEISYK
ncbi:MAG TPA: fibronectin type III domain-containing protein, partial [Clostridiaceae bacterium]|nr:fibronectin type III domain-containing protein [Clostridiaceae bacterium]